MKEDRMIFWGKIEETEEEILEDFLIAQKIISFLVYQAKF
jgi:hypothetical protein